MKFKLPLYVVTRPALGPTQPPLQGVPGLPGRGVNLPPYLTPRLKKEYSTPPLGLQGLF